VSERCPSLADLVLAYDGGLSPSHKTETMAHLHDCGRCRDLLQQANAFVEASADVVDDAIGNVVIFPGKSERAGNARAAMPVSFEDQIGARFDSDAKDAARKREFARRLHKQKQEVIHQPPAAAAWVRQWLPAAALIPLLIVGLALPRMQSVVRAEELLTLAANHERSLPADYAQMLRIQLMPRIPAFAPAVPVLPAAPVAPVARGGARPAEQGVNLVRHSRGGVVRDAGPHGEGASGEYAELARMLSKHGFDFRQPLSLAHVRAWRAALAEKHDEVFVRVDTFVLKTTTSIGALREVELTVRQHDFHVVKLALGFEGMGRLEIAEIEQPAQRAVKSAPVAPAPPATAPVAIASTPAASRSVRGAGVDASLSPATTVVGSRPSAAAAPKGLTLWLDRTFRASPERQTFVPTLQRLIGDVRQHLSELDTMGRRYPEAEVETQWSGADRAALRRRVEERYRRISRDLNDLELRVSVMFGSRTRSFPVTEAPADWRQRAAAALAHAEAMDGQVRDLLTFDDVPVESAEARATKARQMPVTFAALWDVVHAPAGGPASRQ